jgi:hypothetical protein
MACWPRVVPNHYNWKGFRFSLVVVLADCASACTCCRFSSYKANSALSREQLAFGSHQATRVQSRWPAALIRFRLILIVGAYPDEGRQAPLRGPTSLLAPRAPMAGALLNRLAASSRRRPERRR